MSKVYQEDGSESGGIGYYICPICKKKFYRYTYDQAWKTGPLYFCSYTCAKVHDRKNESRKQLMLIKNNHGIRVEVDGVEYKSILDAAKCINVSPYSIRMAIMTERTTVKGHEIKVI